MGEPNESGCRELDDVAAELALGVLTGRQRARAIAHLDHCHACREHVRRLAVTSEQLLELLPGGEPPPGLETRVIDRLGLGQQVPSANRRAHRPGRIPWTPRASRTGRLRSTGPVPAGAGTRGWRRPRGRGVSLAAAAAIIAVACGASGWGLRQAVAPAAPSTGRQASSSLRSASLTSGQGTVGTVFFHTGSPRWLYMTVDVGSDTGTVRCQLRTRGGHLVTIGWFQLAGGYGSWGGQVPPNAADATGARLVDSRGTVLATASFTATR